MTAAAPQLAILTADWLPAAAAAVRLGVDVRSIRRRCSAEWVLQSPPLAKQINGQWFVSPVADSRLRDRVSEKERDLRQEAQLSAQGIDPKYLKIARDRRDCVTGFPEFLLQCRAKNEREALELYFGHLRANGKSPPERSRFFDWRRAYEASGDFGGLYALVPQFAFRARSSKSIATGEAALAHIEQIINAGNRITVSAAISIAQIEADKHADDPAWRIGEYRTVLSAMSKRSRLMKMIADKGPRHARAAGIPKIPRNFNGIPAGYEYVGDEKTLDVWCRLYTSRGWDDAREIKLTAWMDMRARAIVGHILSAHANQFSILGSVKKAFVAFGIPKILRVDRGKDYTAAGKHGLVDLGDLFLPPVLKELGIEYRQVEAYTPWAKPIESFYKTFKSLHDQLYGSFWGGCPSERHEDRAKYVKANLEKLPTLADIDACVSKAIDLYNHTPHGAHDLFGKTPLEAMAAFRDEPIRRENPKILDHLFKIFVGPREVRRDGIRYENNWYGHGDPRFAAMPAKTKVFLAVQPDNVGRAVVCDLKRKPLFEVECLPLDGLTVDQYREKQRELRRLLKPYAEKHTAARNWLLEQNPEEILDAQLKRAKRERPAPVDDAPSLTVFRPDLQEAIDNCEPAPSDVIRSKAVRTGTDDAVNIEDYLGDTEIPAPVESSPFDPWSFIEEGQ